MEKNIEIISLIAITIITFYMLTILIYALYQYYRTQPIFEINDLYESLQNGSPRIEEWIRLCTLKKEESGLRASEEIRARTGDSFNRLMEDVIRHSDKDTLRKIYNHKDYLLLRDIFKELLNGSVKNQFIYLEGVDRK